MEISEKDILNKTNYGLGIYAHILRQYYPDEIVISLSGEQCKPARNPFSDGEKSLNIFLHDWVFVYEDTADSNFKGNPFDFAALYYDLSGKELLEKLNEELNLKIGCDHKFYKNESPVFDIPEEKPVQQIPAFSFFRCPVTNTIPDKKINLFKVYDLIKSNAYKNITGKLSGIENKGQARKYKSQNFDYVTFSGIFSKRSDKSLLKHSGLLTIDFDNIPDILALKQQLLQDEYFDTELLFISPSGNGLKWIIPVDLSEVSHRDYFIAVSEYIKSSYNLEVDGSGKDVSRACFLPYDNDIYINPKYLE